MFSSSPRSSRPRAAGSSLVVGVVVAGLVFVAGMAMTTPARAADDSGSAVTVTAKDQDPDVANSPLPDLKLTVAQTTGLISQAVLLSWEGGKPSRLPSQSNGGGDYLQFAQCWGDDPNVPEGQPAQPDRTTCQYGAFKSVGATRDGNRVDGSIAPQDEAYTAPGSGFFTPTYSAIPFRTPSGDVVERVVDHKQVPGVDVNVNRFFTQYTSNEIPFAGSDASGRGSVKFEMQTVVQSPGLGCGTAIAAPGGGTKGTSCWLVAIPRGPSDSGTTGSTASGLFWDAWKHKLSVRLDFRPTGLHCAIGAAERQIAGSELMAGAVASWQPALCGSAGGDAYTLLTGSEADATGAANGGGDAPLALTTRSLGGDLVDSLQYAPIGLTGLAVTFAIDREPKADGTAPADAVARARAPFLSMNLTPRLVAKLLTNSYVDSLPYGTDHSHLSHPTASGRADNPVSLIKDPDFLAINDKEWAYQAIVTPAVADAIVPQGRFDSAWALWSYAMSDQDGQDFLAGKPDPWGMRINPYSSSTVTPLKGSDVGGQTYPTDTFFKSDPAEIPKSALADAINVITWRPYTNDLDTSAYLTLRGDGQVLGSWNPAPASGAPKYDKAPRGLPGSQAVVGISDTSASAKYETVTASLRNAAGKFVTPTTDTMTAAAMVMTPTAVQRQVVQFDPASPSAHSATAAYPLTVPVYAAANPALTDPATRASYAAFIRFAVSASAQSPGYDIGELPPGYAPIPDAWRAQSLVAAATIQAGVSGQPGGEVIDPAPDFPIDSSSGFGSADQAPQSFDGATPPVSDPEASGAVATALSASRTPADANQHGLGSVIPLSALAGLLGTVGASLIGRIRRRI